MEVASATRLLGAIAFMLFCARITATCMDAWKSLNAFETEGTPLVGTLPFATRAM